MAVLACYMVMIALYIECCYGQHIDDVKDFMTVLDNDIPQTISRNKWNGELLAENGKLFQHWLPSLPDNIHRQVSNGLNLLSLFHYFYVKILMQIFLELY